MRGLPIKPGSLFELVLIAAVAIGLAIGVQAWAVKPYQIPSASMEPTLTVGQRVLVNRLGTHFGAPQVGDVVVFHPPVGADQQRCGVSHPSGEPCPASGSEDTETNFIKRVVAGPGDRLRIQHGIPIVDGRPVVGDWKTVPCRDPGVCDFPHEITVPEGTYFMMGDNRPQSDDSRYWGPVPEDWIVGEAFLTYWPPDRIGGL